MCIKTCSGTNERDICSDICHLPPFYKKSIRTAEASQCVQPPSTYITHSSEDILQTSFLPLPPTHTRTINALDFEWNRWKEISNWKAFYCVALWWRKVFTFVAGVFDRLKQTPALSIFSFKNLPLLQIVTVSITAFSTSGVPFYTRHDCTGFFRVFLCCEKIWKTLAEYSELYMLNFFLFRI